MLDHELDAAAAALEGRIGVEPEILLVLGSGLGAMADAVEDAVEISFAEIDGLPASTVQGHAGRFVAGHLQGRAVLVQSGRYHAYEGHTLQTVVAPVRIAHRMGVRTLIVTNAAGGIREGFVPGSIALISDHLNLHFRSALEGPVRSGETRFPDMTEVYDPGLRRLAHRVAEDAGVPLLEGVYASLGGPAYETPAEIRMLRGMGADMVGMSTVPTATVARSRGMRTLGFSLITNAAAALGNSPLDHAEVMEEGRRGGVALGEVIRGVIARLDESEARG